MMLVRMGDVGKKMIRRIAHSPETEQYQDSHQTIMQPSDGAPPKRKSALAATRCFASEADMLLLEGGATRSELRAKRDAALRERVAARRLEKGKGHRKGLSTFIPLGMHRRKPPKEEPEFGKSGIEDGMLRFGGVDVREYGRTLGESVSGSGPAVGLSWDMVEEIKYGRLQDHEKYIFQKYVKRKKLGRLPI